MAWLLADAHRRIFRGADATRLFVDLGAGEHVSAIRFILERVVAENVCLPPCHAERVHHWIGARRFEDELEGMLMELTR